MRKKQIAIIGLVIIALIGIPITLYIFNKQQEIRSRAENSTILSFSPVSSDTATLQSKVGSIIPLDVMVNPGTNSVSLIKLEIVYDPTKLEPAKENPFVANLTSFSQVVEGPLYSPGKITATLSVGTDLSKVIQQPAKVVTLNFNALNSTNSDELPTSVTFGQNTQVLAIGTNAGPEENVLSSTQPAFITIDILPVPTCAPRPVCLDSTPQCLIPEPASGWCPAPTATPLPLPSPTPAKCQNASTDSIVVIDRSGSMNDRISVASGTKISSAKDAARKFVDILSIDPQNNIGLISFSSTAEVNSPLTNNYSSVKNMITSLSAKGSTCHECAINKVNQEFQSHGRQVIKKVAILLTDGRANTIEGGTRQTTQAIAEQKAMAAINNTSVPNHIVFYTIGLGKDVNSNFLKQIADATGGKYYFSPTVDDLQGIYKEITQVLAKGSVSGSVFNDENNNRVFDTNESKLSGWTINILSEGSTSPQSFTSDDAGTYNVGSLCDGTYKIKEIVKTGWTQTAPVNPSEISVDISGGNAAANLNFGNFQTAPTNTPIPSPTITPVGTTFIINGLLDGIGSRGDNSNPDGTLSNKNPLHPSRDIKISIYDSLNQFVTDASGTMQYSSGSGMFVGKIKTNQALGSKNYIIKASTSNRLVRLLPGIQQPITGQDNQLPNSIFVAGDIVYDNKLDIRDYNSLIDCYSDLAPATACGDEQKKTSSDLNDDGAVNQFDYNLLLREIATQPGQ